MKLKQEREYKQDYPVPSGFSPSTKTTKSRIPVALQSPLKSLKSSIRSASPKMTKKCHFIEQDSFVQGKKVKNSLFITSSIKGSPDPSQLIFEINLGKRRIRHRTTLNDIIFSRF